MTGVYSESWYPNSFLRSFIKIFMQYVWHWLCSFHFPSSTRPPPPPCPSNFMLSLKAKIRKTIKNINKLNRSEKINKKKNIKQKVHTHTQMASILCWPTTPGNGAFPWYTQGHSTEENRSPLSQPVSITNSFLVRDGTLCPLSFLRVCFCLVWTCACYQVSVSSPVYQSCWV